MKDITISQRILLMILTSAIALLCVGSVGLYVAQRQTQSIDIIASNSLPSINLLSDTRQAYMIMRINVMRHLMYKEPASQKDSEKRIEQSGALMLQKLNEYEKYLSDDDDRKLLKIDVAATNEYLAFLRAKLWPHSRSGEMGEERKQIAAEETALAVKTREALEAHMVYNQKNAETATKEAIASAERGRQVSIAVIVGAVIGSCPGTWCKKRQQKRSAGHRISGLAGAHVRLRPQAG